MADALAAFGFPLVFAEPEAGGSWTVVVCDPGTFPAGTAGHRAREAAYRQAIMLAHRHGGGGSWRTSCRADRVPTTAPAGCPIVRSNPGSRAAVPITAMRPAPPARWLPLTPDGYRPGPVDLITLDAVAWQQLEHAYGQRPLGELVRRLVTCADRDWDELLWAELMPAVVHQGTCYSATPAMVPVLADLATSTALPARRRLDLHVALLGIAGQESADLIRSAYRTAYRAGPDEQAPHAQHWAVQARAAVGAATPALLSRWPQQPPAIQFALATFAALHPSHGTARVREIDALAGELAATQPGAYLHLASALLHADHTAATRHAHNITSWHDDADPGWLQAPDLPTPITCGHLLIQGTITIAGHRE